MRTYKLVGDKLNLKMQLSDGDKNSSLVRIFIDLKKSDGTLLEPRFELLYISEGVYLEEAKFMPDELSITAHYYLMNSDGVTASNLYAQEIIKEEFMKDVVGAIVVENLDKKITAITPYVPNIIAAVATSDSIDVTIENEDPIQAEIKNNETIEGVVYEC